MEIGLPNPANLEDAVVTDDGTVVYRSRVDETDVVLQAFDDGSIRIRTVIPDAEAPHRYIYPLRFPEGSRIIQERDGGLTVVSSSGQLIIGVAPPWAVDAEGNALRTAYEVVGDSITQWVDLSTAESFPVVADPYLGIRLIDNVTRSYVSGSGYRYFVYPSW